MTIDQRVAVLHHEVLHFTNAHVFRFGFDSTSSKDDKKNANIATDMSINQYIKNLPKGCIDVKYFKTDAGVDFPKFATAEIYLDLLKENPEAMKNALKQMKKDGLDVKDDGNGEGILDDHSWEELSEEEKKQMAEEMKKIVKRTMEKTSYDKSSLPESIKDLIEEIDTYLRSMNYKQILQSAIKKSVSFTDRASTWRRPNKRYGSLAQGTTLAKLPQLNVYIDTSGSISVKEMNEFLTILNGFLKAGSRKCTLGLWHTSLYLKRPYKLNGKLKEDEVQSGGTDMTEVCEDINKSNPDLSIILTDGYYGTQVDPKCNTIVIISETGGMNHPLKDHKLVKTLGMAGLR
jgi:predicted metal-dependent peptidase